MKATAGRNYVANTKGRLSLSMESIMLLRYVYFSMTNMRKDRVKNSLQKDLHALYEAGNPRTTLLLGNDFPKNVREVKESSKRTSHPLTQLPRYTEYHNQRVDNQAKKNLLSQGNKHRARFRPQYQNSRQSRN